MKTKLIFVRHSESTKNVDKILDGTNEKKIQINSKMTKTSRRFK
jgi:broad specificity phosphatase PhoE